ncbi:aprataxin and PNK-like factor [Hippocampus comes]|uniref:aprataxin and PNK-like factor n=1 Tax=Hippocampus comes TaxID=109280 RepID=UPI00094EE881|nr:PREDICTED: uncharacterized protein LOC109527621 [Hippocampus comes]
MSSFELIPMHGGGDAIQLPPGETVLGRGPFLRVSDKRVSRHHGLLDNRDGRLRLKPTHRNPCFLQSSPGDEPRPLQKDAWLRGASAGGGPPPAADGPVGPVKSEPDRMCGPFAQAAGRAAASPAREKRRRLPSWMMMTAAVRTPASPGRRADEKSRGGEDLVPRRLRPPQTANGLPLRKPLLQEEPSPLAGEQPSRRLGLRGRGGGGGGGRASRVSLRRRVLQEESPSPSTIPTPRASSRQQAGRPQGGGGARHGSGLRRQLHRRRRRQ